MWMTVVTAEVDLGHDGRFTATAHIAPTHDQASLWALAHFDELAASAIKEFGNMTEADYTLYLVDVEVGATFPIDHLNERFNLDRVNRHVGSLALWNWDKAGKVKILADKTLGL